MKKAICLIMALTLCLGSMSVFADVEGTVQGDIMLTSNEIVFNDVVADSMLGEAVYKLVNAGVIAGYGDGTFRPDAGLTRAELCKMINLVFGLKESASETEFTDVAEGDWFYEYVLVAVKAGYIQGFPDKTFRGDDPVTREQVCAIINRVTAAKNLGLFDLPFMDVITDEVSEWAVEDVKKIIANYIMNLESGGKFRATENITRGELAMALEGFVINLPDFYTVTFNTNGGSEVASVEVEVGNTVEKPKAPTKQNYSFGGWYSDEEFKETYDFKKPVTDNITLYAKWNTQSGGGVYIPSNPSNPSTPSDPSGGTTVTYLVKFNTNGGSEIESQYVIGGDPIAQPEEPVKDFYFFLGWYKDSALTEAYDFNSPVTGNLTLYASWEEDTEALNAQRVADLEVIKEVMGETVFTNEFHVEVKDLTMETLELVIADGKAGTIISEDYVKETYGDRISEAKGIYDEVMLPSEQTEFKNIVIDMITECQSRGIQMTLSEIYIYFGGF